MQTAKAGAFLLGLGFAAAVDAQTSDDQNIVTAAAPTLEAQTVAALRRRGLTPSTTEMLVEVEINGVTRSEATVIRDSPEKGLLLRIDDLESWGIQVPRPPAPEEFIPATMI